MIYGLTRAEWYLVAGGCFAVFVWTSWLNVKDFRAWRDRRRAGSGGSVADARESGDCISNGHDRAESSGDDRT